jgi:hypothetical protein
MYKSYFVILDAIQDSGAINMLDAPRWIRNNFNLNKQESYEIMTAWIKYKEENND